jgi:hypothetical protein
MKNLLGIILLLGVALILGCNEEEDCPGCNLNPKIKLKFVPVNTKISVESAFTEVKEKMSAYSDSLENAVEPEIISSLTEKISALRSDSLHYDEIYNQLRVMKVLMDEITAPGAMNLEQFQDSLIRDFAIPVDMQHDTSTFFFNYYELTDTLQIVYKRDIIQNLEGMRMRIYDINVNEELSTFDSVRVKCYKSQCSNDITMIYVYF